MELSGEIRRHETKRPHSIKHNQAAMHDNIARSGAARRDFTAPSGGIGLAGT